MNRSTWQKFEGWLAAQFGAHRTPLSGGASRHTRSDSLSPTLYIECKLRKGFTGAWRRFDEIEKQAKAEGKIPLLAFRIQGQKNEETLLVVRMKHLKEVASMLVETRLA